MHTLDDRRFFLFFMPKYFGFLCNLIAKCASDPVAGVSRAKSDMRDCKNTILKLTQMEQTSTLFAGESFRMYTKLRPRLKTQRWRQPIALHRVLRTEGLHSRLKCLW